ncbi:hypothetical protein K525DRAFT_211455 [Schizophyllum commune Loenen D]|nr:hypothetical protein K525DRAFT_211455 [Schizophyllum commune Loenen D]
MSHDQYQSRYGHAYSFQDGRSPEYNQRFSHPPLSRQASIASSEDITMSEPLTPSPMPRTPRTLPGDVVLSRSQTPAPHPACAYPDFAPSPSSAPSRVFKPSPAFALPPGPVPSLSRAEFDDDSDEDDKPMPPAAWVESTAIPQVERTGSPWVERMDSPGVERAYSPLPHTFEFDLRQPGPVSRLECLAFVASSVSASTSDASPAFASAPMLTSSSAFAPPQGFAPPPQLAARRFPVSSEHEDDAAPNVHKFDLDDKKLQAVVFAYLKPASKSIFNMTHPPITILRPAPAFMDKAIECLKKRQWANWLKKFATGERYGPVLTSNPRLAIARIHRVRVQKCAIELAKVEYRYTATPCELEAAKKRVKEAKRLAKTAVKSAFPQAIAAMKGARVLANRFEKRHTRGWSRRWHEDRATKLEAGMKAAMKKAPSPAPPRRTSNKLPQRIENLRVDPLVRKFGAHHVKCACCLEKIATEGRWEVYAATLFNKHVWLKCEGLKRWASEAPTPEEWTELRAKRNRYAEAIHDIYVPVACETSNSECHCYDFGLEWKRRIETRKNQAKNRNWPRLAGERGLILVGKHQDGHFIRDRK